jgi:endonuclease III
VDRQLSVQPQSVSLPRDHEVAKRGIAPKRKPKAKGGASVARTPRKRKKLEPFTDDNINELPHNLGRLAPADELAESIPTVLSTRKRSKHTPVAKQEVENDFADVTLTVKQHELPADLAAPPELSNLKRKRTKANPYGLSPGETPYPDHPHPTPEECREVARLLSKVHGEIKAPPTIPAPSLASSGCGEVPSILDALIRTLLSSATTEANSSRAFKGLVDKFGLLEDGIGKGSVNWDNVRKADVADVFGAIKCGGLAAVKSKRIKEILELVYQENVARRNAFVKAAELDGRPFPPKGAENETGCEKDMKFAHADLRLLSLDHLRALSSDDALKELIKYPGIGPKTASCVLLFCMQRPSFAVDTHVFRLCKWLGWVPEKASRNTTYSHCEVRVPNELKYELHQLFIMHGRRCPRCRAATGEGGEGWGIGCPIDHLVKRTGKRKGGPVNGKGAMVKQKKKGKKGEESDASTENESETEEIDSAEESDG